MDQVHEYENMVANVLTEGMKMYETLQVNMLLEKFSLSSSDYRSHLKHKKKNLALHELISHMHTEEANRQKDKLISDLLNSVKGNLVESFGVNIDRFKTKSKQFVADKSSQKKGHHKVVGGTIEKTKLIYYVYRKQENKSYSCNQRKIRLDQRPSHVPIS